MSHLDIGDEASLSEASWTATETDDFFKRYTCTLEPDVRIKLKKRFKKVKFGSIWTVKNPRQNSGNEQSLALTAQPAERNDSLRSKLLNKVTVLPGHSTVLWRSRKLYFWQFFKLKLTAGYNWQTHQPTVCWNVTTKWNQDDHKSLMKVQMPLARRIMLMPHFQARYGLPSMGGGIGSADEAANEVDQGYCHTSLPKVDLVFQLERHPETVWQPFWKGRSLLGFRRRSKRVEDDIPQEAVASVVITERPDAAQALEPQQDETDMDRRIPQHLKLARHRQPQEQAQLQPAPEPLGRATPWQFPLMTQPQRQAGRKEDPAVKGVPAPWRLQHPLHFPWLVKTEENEDL